MKLLKALRWLLTSLSGLILFMFLLSPLSAGDETRGVWVNKAQLLEGEDFLDKLFYEFSQANLNAVYINAYFQGYVVYPDSEYLPQHPDYRDRDYLGIAVELAKKHGLKTYAWMEYGFYGYHDMDIPAAESLGPLFDKHLSWISLDREGNYFIHNPQWGDYLPISPVVEDAQDFLIGLFSEVMEKYPFDGIDYDRIRFGTAEHCFSDTTRILFLRDSGIDISEMASGSEEEALFNAWRKSRLNDFVERLSGHLRNKHPGIFINSAVVPPYRIDEMGQDWYTWAEYGWVDGISPMLYYEEIEDEARTALNKTPDNFPVFFGLDTQGNSPEVVAEQVQELRNMGAKGFVFWYAGTIREHLDHLKEQVFTEEVSPYARRQEPVKEYQMPDFQEKKEGLQQCIEVDKVKEPGQ